MSHDAQVGDTVAATFRPQWENRGGKPYTVTDVVWEPVGVVCGHLMVGPNSLAGALSVDVVERAS